MIVIKRINNQWKYFFSQIFTRLALSLSLSLLLKTSYNWYEFLKKEKKDPHVLQGGPQQSEPMRSLVVCTQHLREESGASTPRHEGDIGP